MPLFIPAAFGQQTPSYAEPVPDPGTAPCDQPLVCFQVNIAWVPYMLGSMMQLAQPTTWIAADDTTLNDILDRVSDLLSAIGSAVPCNSTIPPIGPGGAAQACNIAGYIATDVIKQSLQRAIDAVQANQTVLGYGILIMGAIPGFGGIFGIALKALDGFYTAIAGGTLTDYQDAISDPNLFGHIACAIYSAISSQGMVTQGNFAAIQTNLAAVTYPHADVKTTILQYVSDLGASGLETLQPPGVIAAYDCSACGGGGTASGPATAPIHQAAGTVNVTITAGNTTGSAVVTFEDGWPSAPILTVTSGSQDLIASYNTLTSFGFNATLTAAVPVLADTTVTVTWIANLPGAV